MADITRCPATLHDLMQETIIPLKMQVNRQLESMRSSGFIGKSLQAEVMLTVVDDVDFIKLHMFGGRKRLAAIFCIKVCGLLEISTERL